ncbi:MAG: hypothetical protein J6R67_09620 [Treponema sp.]|nr:hypothetical protein [Treponema sp.]
MNKVHKGIAIRGIICLCYLLLAILMFVTGRTHTLLVDNKGNQDGSYSAVNGMTVVVDNTTSEELLKNDRAKVVVKGQNVKLLVKSFDGSVNQEFRLKIPLLQDTVLVSIPKLIAGIEPALEPFTTD